MLSNAYFLATFRFDTAEKEPAICFFFRSRRKNCKHFAILLILCPLSLSSNARSRVPPRWRTARHAGSRTSWPTAASPSSPLAALQPLRWWVGEHGVEKEMTCTRHEKSYLVCASKNSTEIENTNIPQFSVGVLRPVRALEEKRSNDRHDEVEASRPSAHSYSISSICF